MKIDVERKYCKTEYTIGAMCLDGVPFCDTLEDRVRESGEKVAGETAIPAGEYDVRVTYSPKFRRPLPELLSVPMFSGIRIHAGNTAADTAGCILVGRNTAKGRLTESRKTETELVRRMLQASARGERITIRIR